MIEVSFMEQNRTTFRQGLMKLIEPIYPNNIVASIYCAVALALLLVYLYQGNALFFILTVLGPLLPNAEPAEIEWWGVLCQFSTAFMLFLIVPAAALKLFTRESLRDLGLGLGDWRFYVIWIIPIGLVLMAVSALVASVQPDFLATYPMAKLAVKSPERLVVYELAYGVLYYLAYEAFFRGFLQLGLAKYIGDHPAILVQTVMTTLLHIGKPVNEIWSALAAGFLFGLIVVRTRSIWPLFIIHWALGVMTDLACAHASGIW
jgi:membrane protease YdiL (CAAX protease family)